MRQYWYTMFLTGSFVLVAAIAMPPVLGGQVSVRQDAQGIFGGAFPGGTAASDGAGPELTSGEANGALAEGESEAAKEAGNTADGAREELIPGQENGIGTVKESGLAPGQANGALAGNENGVDAAQNAGGVGGADSEKTDASGNGADTAPGTAKSAEAGASGAPAESAETGGSDASAENGTAGAQESAGTAESQPGEDPVKAAIAADFADVLFIGDSRTVGLSEYGNLGQAEVFANTGMSVFNLLSAREKLKDGSSQTLEELLSGRSFKVIYLMLGINELGYGKSEVDAQYRAVVDRIRQLQPDAALVLEANLHVTAAKAQANPVYSNAKLNELNLAIAQIAADKGCYYRDVNSQFDDAGGALDAQYSGDGVHVLGKYYARWAQWIRDAG